jgi:hypothetical protein
MDHFLKSLPFVVGALPFLVAWQTYRWSTWIFNLCTASWLSMLIGLVAFGLIKHVYDKYFVKPYAPLECRERPTTIIIGGGFGGICAAVKLKKAGVDYKIIEKSAHFGGTWFDNTYPGAACDVPGHLYCFSFDLNPNWTKVYGP